MCFDRTPHRLPDYPRTGDQRVQVEAQESIEPDTVVVLTGYRAQGLRRVRERLSVGCALKHGSRTGRARSVGCMAANWRGKGKAVPLGELVVEEQGARARS